MTFGLWLGIYPEFGENKLDLVVEIFFRKLFDFRYVEDV
jgi:hypothetical protein